MKDLALFALPLNIQFFSADSGADGGGTSTNDDDPTKDDIDLNKDTGGSGDTPEDKSFTQEDIDRIVAERLARDRKSREDAAERKRLEDEEQYKELANTYKQEIEALKADALKAKKDDLLFKAGYTDVQVGLLRKLVEGETDEEILSSIENVKIAVPVETVKDYVDPGVGNGIKVKPDNVDQYDKGKSLFARIRGIEG